jgi:hypothetical protein
MLRRILRHGLEPNPILRLGLLTTLLTGFCFPLLFDVALAQDVPPARQQRGPQPGNSVISLSGNRTLEFIGVIDPDADSKQIWTPDGRTRELKKPIWDRLLKVTQDSNARDSGREVAEDRSDPASDEADGPGDVAPVSGDDSDRGQPAPPSDAPGIAPAPTLIKRRLLFVYRGTEVPNISMSQGPGSYTKPFPTNFGLSAEPETFALEGNTYLAWDIGFRPQLDECNLRLFVWESDWTRIGLSADRKVEAPRGVVDVSRLVQFNFWDWKETGIATWSLPLPPPAFIGHPYLKIRARSRDGGLHEPEGRSGSDHPTGQLAFDRCENFKNMSADKIDSLDLLVRACAILNLNQISMRPDWQTEFSVVADDIAIGDALRQKIAAANEAKRRIVRVYASGDGAAAKAAPFLTGDETTIAELRQKLGRPDARAANGSLLFSAWWVDFADGSAGVRVPPENLELRLKTFGPSMNLEWVTPADGQLAILAWMGKQEEHEIFLTAVGCAIAYGGEKSDELTDSHADALEGLKEARKRLGVPGAALERDAAQVEAAVQRCVAAIKSDKFSEFAKTYRRSGGGDPAQTYQSLRKLFHVRSTCGLIKAAIARGDSAVVVTTCGSPDNVELPESLKNAIVFGLKRNRNQWSIESIAAQDVEGVIVAICQLYSERPKEGGNAK